MVCYECKMSPGWSTFVAVFALFYGNACHAACSWGKLEGKNYIKVKDSETALKFDDVWNIGEVSLHDCIPESKVGEFLNADYRDESRLLLVWIDIKKLKEQTPSGVPPHVICFFLKASNCDDEQWFEVEVQETNTYDPSLLDENGDGVFKLTYEVSMPLLKGVNIGVDLRVKDIDLSNIHVNVSVLGDELHAVYDGTVDSLKKVHRYYLVPTDDLKFSEKTFDLFIEDGGEPSRSSKAQLILEERGHQVQEPIFKRYYYEGDVINGSLSLESIDYTNADINSIQLLSEQGYQKYFILEVTPDFIYLQADKDVEYIKDNRIVLVLVASQPNSSLVQHTAIFIELRRKEEEETNRNCTGVVHVDNIENVNVNVSL